MKIRQITKLPHDIEYLVRESEKEGFAFISRLKVEWESAVNCFDANGEFLLLASTANHSIGVCGVNIDPYLSDKGIARLRHLYVLPTYRSQSIGSQLVKSCLDHLSNTTTLVRLRVPDENTGLFYEKLGFKAINNNAATHILTINSNLPE